VNLTVKSTFNFEATNPNTIFQAVTSTNNIYQPVDSTLGLPPGLQPDLADKRIPFYTTINPTILPRYRFNGFWNATTTPIPVYLTGALNFISAALNWKTCVDLKGPPVSVSATCFLTRSGKEMVIQIHPLIPRFNRLIVSCLFTTKAPFRGFSFNVQLRENVFYFG